MNYKTVIARSEATKQSKVFSRNARLFPVHILVFLVLLFFLVAPAYAQKDTGIVPCGGKGQAECTFSDLLRVGGLADRVFQFFVNFTIVFGVLSFAIAGVMFITSAGNEGQRQTAKTIMWNTVIGIALAAAAFVIVSLILRALTQGTVQVGELGAR